MKYMLIFASPEGGAEDASPEEMQAVMDAWFDYDRQLTESGAKLAGEALQESATATTVRIADGGERLVTDGPFAESKEQVGGFYLLECKDLDEALEWAKKAPLREGGTEVRPVMVFDQPGSGEPAPAGAEASS